MTDLFPTALLAGLLVGVLASVLLLSVAHRLIALLQGKSPTPRDRRLDGAQASLICVTSAASAYCWGLTWQGAGAILCCALLLTLARIDAQTGLLPDLLTLPLLWAGMLFHLAGGWIPLASSVGAAALGYGVLWLIFTLYRWRTGRDGMGFGDFKLSAALGAWLGLQSLAAALLVASLAGCLVGYVGQRTGRWAPGGPIPFGPFLVLGGILILFFDHATLP